jgi:hypothetical protein
VIREPPKSSAKRGAGDEHGRAESEGRPGRSPIGEEFTLGFDLFERSGLTIAIGKSGCRQQRSSPRQQAGHMTEGRQPFTAEIKTLAKGPSTYDPLENNIRK